MKKNYEEERSLFYLSYTTLVAGLFFVFLFILAAVLIKNSYARLDFNLIEARLNDEKTQFEAQKESFKEEQKIIYELGKNLKGTELNFSSKKDEEMLILLSQLNEKEIRLKNLKDNFTQLREEFANLRFIKNNLILELQAKFDFNITVNPQTGALILFNNTLFNQGSYLLKNEVKPKLRNILNEYLSAILQDSSLANSIEQISIQAYIADEGHSLLHKIDLASKRSNELMGFVLSFYKDERLNSLLFANTSVQNDEKEGRVELDFELSKDFIIKKTQELFDK